MLSNPFANRYKFVQQKDKNKIVKEKVNLNTTTAQPLPLKNKSRSYKLQTTTVTPTDPSTARITFREQPQPITENQLGSIKEMSKVKQIVPHSSIRMRYLDRRITMNDARLVIGLLYKSILYTHGPSSLFIGSTLHGLSCI